MNSPVVFNVVDAHVGGEPIRVLTGPLLLEKQETMLGVAAFVKSQHDHVRRLLTHEPRGHRDMFAALLTPPCNPEAQFGVVYAGPAAYYNMCGHGTIGVATVLVETGVIPAVEPETKVILDTPAGIVRAAVGVRAGRVTGVTFEGVPSFRLHRAVTVAVPGIGKITCDIAYGGNFFVVVSACQLGVRVKSGQIAELTARSMALRDAVNERLCIQHPVIASEDYVDEVMVYDDPTLPNALNAEVVIFGNGQFDRSPCGTGTSARAAALFADGKLAVGEEFIHESIIGTTFRARVVRQVDVGGIDGVTVAVTGNAYLTGTAQFIRDPQDPLGDGFLVPTAP